MNESAHFDLCGLSALFLRSEIVLVRVIHQHMIFGAILRALNKAFYVIQVTHQELIYTNIHKTGFFAGFLAHIALF